MAEETDDDDTVYTADRRNNSLFQKKNVVDVRPFSSNYIPSSIRCVFFSNKSSLRGREISKLMTVDFCSTDRRQESTKDKSINPSQRYLHHPGAALFTVMTLLAYL